MDQLSQGEPIRAGEVSSPDAQGQTIKKKPVDVRLWYEEPLEWPRRVLSPQKMRTGLTQAEVDAPLLVSCELSCEPQWLPLGRSAQKLRKYRSPEASAKGLCHLAWLDQRLSWTKPSPTKTVIWCQGQRESCLVLTALLSKLRHGPTYSSAL